MRYLSCLLCVGFLMLVFLSSCSDDPTSSGVGLIPKQDKISLDTLDSNEDNISLKTESYITDVNFGSSTRLLLGKYTGSQNQTVKSNILVEFRVITLPDSISDDVQNDSLNIISSKVKFSKDYVIGDDDQESFFSIKEIKSDWRGDEITRDSLENLNFGDEISPGDLTESDSTLSFSIPENLSMQWLKSVDDEENYENHGIYLTPDASMAKMIGVRAIGTLNEEDFPTLELIVEKPGSYQDTISFTSNWDAHIAEGSISQAEDHLFIQGSIPVRTKMSFDLDSFDKGTVINQANLKLYYDDALSYKGQSLHDSIEVQFVTDSADMTVESDDRTALLSRKEGYYAGDITSSVQKWINGEENHGLRLRLRQESSHIDRLALFNEKSGNNNPFIEIIYTKKN